MARQTPVQNDTPSVEEMIAKAAAEEQWETVSEEVPTRVIFDTIGDVFVGFYQGTEVIPAEKNITKDKPEGEEFSLFLFRGLDGKLYSFNSSTRLVDAMAKVEKGRKVMLKYVKDVKVKDQPSPMKDITVSVAAANIVAPVNVQY